MKKVILAILMASSSLFARESELVKDLNIEAGYGIYSNLIDRGASLTANAPTGAGEIALSYNGVVLAIATFGTGGTTEIDTVIGYDYEGIDNLALGAAFLSISTSDTNGGTFQFDNDRELSFFIAYDIPDIVGIGFDIMTNIKASNFIIYQGSLTKSFGDLGLELLFAQQTSNISGNQFKYYQFGAVYPCIITGGEWGVALANTTQSGSQMTYMVSHSFTF